MQTIEVIPHRVLKNSDTGQEISIFSALPPGNWESVTKGYSWEKVDHRGSVTRGLCRRPVATIEEANQVALDFAEAIPNTQVILMDAA